MCVIDATARFPLSLIMNMTPGTENICFKRMFNSIPIALQQSSTSAVCEQF